MARPTKYKADFPGKAEKLAEQGLIDTQIAKKLHISGATYYLFQNEYPEFSEAIKRGKAESDQEVVDSLRKKAVGFEYTEVATEAKVDDKGVETITSKKTTKKYYPPDTGATAFWLKNRQPNEWRDVRQIEGNLGGAVIIMADESTKKLLDGIEKLGTKSPKDRDDEDVSSDD